MFIATALMAISASSQVIAVLKDEEVVERGIVAEIIERPAGVSSEQFAQELIEVEGLEPWTGQQIDFPSVDGAMATKAVISTDGREVIVKYMPGDAAKPGKVCLLRLARGGWSAERWTAYRWCAKAFGLSLAETAPPPIRVDNSPR